MKTFILCGGFGTRLDYEGTLIAKPMVRIGKEPILMHIIQNYTDQDINEFVFCLGHKFNTIINYFLKENKNKINIIQRDKENINKPLQLSLDTNIQYLVKRELEEALKIFKAKGAASILINSDNGEVLSLVSLPDFNINKRADLTDKAFMNKITKGVFELGSIFKTS